MPAPGGMVDWDGDGSANRIDEWIELNNVSGEALELEGWMLDDSAEGDTKPHTFPQGTILQPGEYRVFFRRDTKIILNNDEDEVRLLSPDGTVMDEVSYEDAAYDVSYSRMNGCSGEWIADWSPSPGEANDLPGLPPGGTLLCLPLILRPSR